MAFATHPAATTQEPRGFTTWSSPTVGCDAWIGPEGLSASGRPKVEHADGIEFGFIEDLLGGG